MTYQIIYADPPWRTTPWGKQPEKGNRAPPYPTMTDSELLALPMKDLAAKDAVLFMWILDHKGKFAFELGEAWGFSHNTTAFYWFKRNMDGCTWGRGTGYTTRNGAAERCELFVKGNGVKRLNGGVWRLYDDVIFYPETIIHPVMEHSRKPDTIRDRIEDLYGDLSRVELFARRGAPGWDAWGNEIECSPQAAAVLGEPERIEVA